MGREAEALQHSSNWLQDYIDEHLARGGFAFHADDAIKACKVSPIAFKRAADRLQTKHKLLRVQPGIVVPIPPEYRDRGAPPIVWFIDAIMRSRKTDYCVGLLSAATFHGATHQAVQTFQVLTANRIKPIKAGNEIISTIHKSDLSKFPYQQAQTDTGYFRLSTPEVTAFDILKFHKQSGGYLHIPTVLKELSESLNAKKIVQVSEIEPDISNSQRLGYLLSWLGFEKLVEPLKNRLEQQSLRMVPLVPVRNFQKSDFKTDETWRVVINEELESDI
ncbi:MAG: hypothetical protein KGQ59_03440 [Bdellovibrionales bacterium]|nr:hypothetical protein [Bdellovibrionales bacterium]